MRRWPCLGCVLGLGLLLAWIVAAWHAMPLRADTDSSLAGSATAWEPLGPDEPAMASRVLFSPAYATDRTVYIVCSNGLLKTTDGGLHWQPLKSFARTVVQGLDASPDFLADQTLLAYGELGLVRSTDAGDTWARMSAPGLTDANITGLAYSPNYTDDHSIFVGTDPSGVFRTWDAGGHWEPYNTANPNYGSFFPAGARIFSFPRNYGPTERHIFASTYAYVDQSWGAVFEYGDNGWRIRASHGADDIDVSPNYSQDGIVYFGDYRGAVGCLACGGEAPPNPQPYTLGQVSVSPNFGVDRALIQAGTLPVRLSQDGGVTWQPYSPTLPAGGTTLVEFVPTYLSDPALLSVVGDRIYRAADLGGAWQLVADAVRVPSATYRTAVSPDYDADGLVMASYALDGTHLARSTDRGASWQTIIYTTTEWYGHYLGYLPVFSPDYAHDRTVYDAGMGSRLNVSTDGGATWTSVPGPASYPNTYVYDIALSPNYAADGTIFLTDGTLYKSPDRGQQWERAGYQPCQRVALSPDYAHDQTVWSAKGNDVQRSTNGGETWVQRNTGLPGAADAYLLALSPLYASDQTLFVGSSAAGLYRSTNGGQSWIALGASVLGSWQVRGLAFAPDYATSYTLYAGTYGGGVFISPDGGTTWAPFGDGLANRMVESLAISRGERWDLFAATAAGVWRVILRAPAPAATPTATISASATATTTPSATPTASATPPFTPTSSSTASLTGTPTPTTTDTLTPTEMATYTSTPVPSPTATATLVLREVYLPLVMRKGVGIGLADARYQAHAK